MRIGQSREASETLEDKRNRLPVKTSQACGETRDGGLVSAPDPFYTYTYAHAQGKGRGRKERVWGHVDGS